MVQFLRTPWVSASSILVGIVGVVLALYFGLRPGDSREPQCALIGKPVLVFDPGVTTAFGLEPKKLLWAPEGFEAADHKVWAITFAVWNSGELPIKPDDVLSPLIIEVGSFDDDLKAIWELRPIALSRKEIDFQVVAASLSEITSAQSNPITVTVYDEQGRVQTPEAVTKKFVVGGSFSASHVVQVPIDFRILEQGDGALVQLIYSGQKNVPVILKGSVEGVRRTTFPPVSRDLWPTIAGFAVSVAVLLPIWFLGGSILIVAILKRANDRGLSGIVLGLSFVLILAIGVGISLVISLFIEGLLSPPTVPNLTFAAYQD